MLDAFDSAVSAAENRGIYYGKVQVTADYVVFVKGTGKLLYNENQHEPRDRRTEIHFVLSPIDEMNITTLIQRSLIAESDEWAKIVWPSLKDGCQIKNPRQIDGAFVKVQLIPNGRTWNDKKTGEPRQGTTMKFLATYANEVACKAAFVSDGNSASASAPTTTAPNPAADAMAVDMTPTAPNPAADAMAVDMTPTANNPERQTALMFVETLVKQAAGNRDQLAQLISTMPFIAKWFSVDSPEVKQLLAA